MTPQPEPDDSWSTWLRRLRHGGDHGRDRQVRHDIERIADRVIDAARLSERARLLDVGTGDGILALRAIERLGAGLLVTLTDISEPALRLAMDAAERYGVLAQCEFRVAPAEHLHGIADSAANAVTMRSVLAYVDDKALALAEAYRVLKPGGWLSIAEPLMQEEALNTIGLRRMVESRDFDDGLLPLIHRWKAAQYPDTVDGLDASPLTRCSERELVRLVEEGGFVDIHMESHVDVRRVEAQPWKAFIGSSPHPLAPSLETILACRFTHGERELFEAVLRPIVESGASTAVDRVVYLSARRPVDGIHPDARATRHDISQADVIAERNP